MHPILNEMTREKTNKAPGGKRGLSLLVIDMKETAYASSELGQVQYLVPVLRYKVPPTTQVQGTMYLIS